MSLSRKRVAVAGAAVAGALLFIALSSSDPLRRRLRSRSPARRLVSEALLPANIRKWVHKPGTAPEHQVVVLDRGVGRKVTAYRSAATELVWLDGARAGHICQTSELPDVQAGASHWLAYSARTFRPGGQPAPHPTPEEKAALSHFHVQVGENEHYTEPIEPLHGVARHPFAKVGCPHSEQHPHDVRLANITYIVIHNQCGRPGPKPRTLLFDMGASTGFKGVPGGIWAKTAESAGGPSLPLFYRIYQDRCLEPDALFAWEPNPRVSGPEWWGELPAEIRAKVHYFNDFVSEGELTQAEDLSLAPGKHPAQSFLQILEATAKKEDFVAVKIDIDTPFVELTIVEAIADRPEIAALIDELYFEYHFEFDGMRFGWGPNVDGDVDTAVGLMHRLRALGVRAHFWI